MKSLTEVQRILHSSLSGLNDEQKQLAIKTIFGQYALSGMTAIVDTAPTKFHELTDAMHKTGITADLIRDKKIGLGFIVQQLTSHYQTIIKEIGHLLEGPFRELLVVLQKVMNAWDGLSAPAKTAIAVISAVTGVVLLVGGALIAAVAGIGMFSTAITAGIGVLAAISGPILIIIGVIAALGLAIYGLKYAWDRDLGGIQEKTKIAWDWIKTQFEAAVPYIAPKVKKLVDDLTTWWASMSARFGDAVHNIWNFIVWLQPIWEASWELIKGVAKTVFDAIYTIVEGTLKMVRGALSLFIDLFSARFMERRQVNLRGRLRDPF